MKTGAEKSSTTSSSTATRAASRPFVARAGEGDFFAPARRAGGPPVQMKMTVNQPGDKFEQEADRMADKVVRMPAPAAAREEKLQRQPEEKLRRKEEEKILKAALPEEKVQKAADDRLQKAAAAEEKLQRKAPEGGGSAAVGGDVQSAIRNKTTGGEPLAADVRGHMEPRFNADFGNIRVHRDSESAALNNQLSARAFTYQNHIFFSRNQYQPGSSDGKQLLAHELTHTIQQGHAVQRAPEALPPTRSGTPAGAVQRASAPLAAPVPMSSEAVNISSNVFNPSQRVKDEIEARGSKGLEVRVIVPGLTAEGRIKLRADSAKNYQSFTKGSMPLLNAWTQQLGGMHLNFAVRNSEIANGYASLKPGGGDTNDWLQLLQKNSSLLGGLGLQVGHLPAPINKFDNGKLTLGVSNLKVQVGSFLDALFNLSIEDMSQPRIDATADVDIKGMAKGQLKLNNDAGKLIGQVSLAVSYKSFSGEGIVKYNADGSVDVGGKAAYNADKLSGEIQFVSTDIEAANSFTRNAIAAAGGKENIQDAGPPAPVPVPKEGQKKRALAATGQLGFNLTKWFAGKVNVIVDGKGAITVIGRIAPPAEIELFKQKDWDKEIISFEAKAYYGLPVVGNLNLFANISLHALAKLGPAKIYNIEILGTYSTDPEVQKSIQISGSINISAYGGLMLRAEGGAGVEIASHDLKFGVGLHADVGVKAYADARPTIGYRDPGVFYISGTLEVAAQPVLGLGGDFFIALETPWWSPLSDDRWTWPLFSKEWPLADPIGISAVVKDYELGSGKVPEIELKKPEFDPSKLMTNMVDRTLPDKSGGAGAGKGQFKEDGSVPKPAVPPAKPAPKVADTKPARKGAPPKAGKSATPDPAAAKDQESAKIFQNAAKLLEVQKSKGALTAAALNQALVQIKVQVAGIDFAVQLTGSKWMVTPKARGKSGKKLELNAQVEDLKRDDKMAAIAEAEKLLPAEGFEEQTVRDQLAPIKSRYKLLTLNLVVDSRQGQIEIVHFTASASKEEQGQPKQVKLAPAAPIAPVPRDSWIRILPADPVNPDKSLEQVITSTSVKRRTTTGVEMPLVFSTATQDGGFNKHFYKDESARWARTELFHPSKFVVPVGTAQFKLIQSKRAGDVIRKEFYGDSQSIRDSMKASKLPARMAINKTHFYSQEDPAKEAKFGYKIDPARNEALVPVTDASADHKTSIAHHWTNLRGNYTVQANREGWNQDADNYQIISGKLNSSLGGKGANYTYTVGLSFRGPSE